MATIRFYVEVKKDKLQVMAQFQHGQQKPKKYTGYNLPAEKLGKEWKYWNAKKKQVRSHPDAKVINDKLDTWQQKFKAYKEECDKSWVQPDMYQFIQMLDNRASNRVTVSKAPMALELMNWYLEYAAKQKKASSLRTDKPTVNQFMQYEQDYGQVALSQLNEQFFQRYTAYLIEEHNNTNSTIARKLRRIKTMVTQACKRLNITYNPYHMLAPKIKQIKAPKFPLQPDELATLKSYAFSDTSRQRLKTFECNVLFAFTLACETGLRHSDCAQLSPEHIKTHITANGIIKYIDLVNEKGEKYNDMPISNDAGRIIDLLQQDGRRIFNTLHSQSSSRELKKIFFKLKLSRPCQVTRLQGTKAIKSTEPLYDVISFHMGRNTYITRLLSAGLPAPFVQKNAGHSNLDVTMIYFRPEDETRWVQTLQVLNNPTTF